MIAKLFNPILYSVYRAYLDMPEKLRQRIPKSLRQSAQSLLNALGILIDKYFNLKEYKKLSFLAEGLKDRPACIDNNLHEAIVKRLYHPYQRAKEAQRDVPLPYRPGGGWKELINIGRVEYIKALNNNDTSQLSNLLRNFFRNSGSDGIISPSYSAITGDYITQKKFIHTTFASYEIWKDFVGGDLKDVSVPFIGNPWGIYIEGNLIMWGSFRDHRYANIVKNLLTDVDNPVVAEIGGGYGGFAYYLLKERDDLTYINFDLPEILPISSYYLISAFPDKKVLLYEERQLRKISQETINSYDIILLPNFEIQKLDNDSIDLFINTLSFSEMDFASIAEYISEIGRTGKRYFFHENSDQKIVGTGGHIEVPASQFPIPDNFKRVYKHPSLLVGERVKDRVKEYLYEHINR